MGGKRLSIPLEVVRRSSPVQRETDLHTQTCMHQCIKRAPIRFDPECYPTRHSLLCNSHFTTPKSTPRISLSFFGTK